MKKEDTYTQAKGSEQAGEPPKTDDRVGVKSDENDNKKEDADKKGDGYDEEEDADADEEQQEEEDADVDEKQQEEEDADADEEQQEEEATEEMEAQEESQMDTKDDDEPAIGTSASQSLMLLKDAVKSLRSRADEMDDKDELSNEDMVTLNITLSGMNDSLEKACLAMNGRYNKHLNNCQLNITDSMLDIVKSVISKKPENKKVEKKQVEFAKYAPLLMFGDSNLRKRPTTTIMRKLFIRPLSFDMSQPSPYNRRVDCSCYNRPCRCNANTMEGQTCGCNTNTMEGQTCGCNTNTMEGRSCRCNANTMEGQTCRCNANTMEGQTCPPSCPYACNRMNKPTSMYMPYQQPYQPSPYQPSPYQPSPNQQLYVLPPSYDAVPPASSFAYPFVGGKRTHKTTNKKLQRGGGSVNVNARTQRATYSTQGVCHNCGSSQSPQHYGQAPHMPASCPPSFYPAVPPVPLYQQQSGGYQPYVLDAQGGMGPVHPTRQGGQQFVVPIRAPTKCKTSVFPANGVQPNTVTSVKHHKSSLVSAVKKGGGRRRRVAPQKSRRARK